MAQALATRAQIILVCATGASNWDVAASLKVSEADGGQVASPVRGTPLGRAVRRAPPGGVPHDHRRPGRSGDRQEVGGEAAGRHALVDEVDGAGDGDEPERGQSDLAGVRNGPASLSESFKLSTDPLFVDKVRDVVGLYMDPPERAVVV